jgi:AraC-like DNA-binding protein
MNSEPRLIDILAGSRLFRDYRKAYVGATGLPLALRPTGPPVQLPAPSPVENEWCGLVSGRMASCAACQRFRGQVADGSLSNPATMACACGLAETVVPVMLGARPVGYLRTGRVVLRERGELPVHRALKAAARCGAKLDEKVVQRACTRLPTTSRKKLDSAQELLVLISDHLSMRFHQLLEQRRHAEPPAISRAREFVAEHLVDDLTLGRVASAVNMSPFYFCKQFRKATGVTLTEFICRQRIERSKQLLLNRNFRVTEIAFESGFQSVTHFNRTFRRIVGESPTRYREHVAVL